jgi:cell division protein ZapA (FtsZ GTPase activity inhibitor)
MEFKICINKEAIKSTQDLEIVIFYEHPKITISLLVKNTNKNKVRNYTYSGSIEAILKSNYINQAVNAESFIDGVKNVNYFNVDDKEVAIFSFPLQINFIGNVVKIVCTRVKVNKNCCIDSVKLFEDKFNLRVSEVESNIENIKNIESSVQLLETSVNGVSLDVLSVNSITEKLTKKLITLDNKVEYMEAELRKNSHSDVTIIFDEDIYFNEYVTSINLVTRLTEKPECVIVLPKNLQDLSVIGGYNKVNENWQHFPNLEFSQNIERLYISTIYNFNIKSIVHILTLNLTELNIEYLQMDGEQFIDFSLMSNLKKLTLRELNHFDQFIDFSLIPNLKVLELNNLNKFNQPIDLISMMNVEKFTLVTGQSGHFNQSLDFTLSRSIKMLRVSLITRNQSYTSIITIPNIKFDSLSITNNNTSATVKCLLEDEQYIKTIAGSVFGKLFLPKSKEVWCRTDSILKSRLISDITFF